MDKALFADSLQSVITCLNKFTNGSTTLDDLVKGGATSTGRFAGDSASMQDHVENRLVVLTTAAAREPAAGANLNGNADLTIRVDPTTSYFKPPFFDTVACDAPRTVPKTRTDGMTVLLHVPMRGLGIVSFRDASGSYGGAYRTTRDMYTTRSGGATNCRTAAWTT